ncbi:SPOC like C-terminal domain-containing protein [Mucor mucedo]|uniref:SPOC like C-terminal domain-containing protein n=1 Tax=Mucor mucedo TaxID=29922 RepID=UPI002220B455|nr:SPOC like C-terminal domain-containing protein [Mucor mucedo]KAI7892671.1 SPOC like C-terminal domain-containing protein [Mucor mucedo]
MANKKATCYILNVHHEMSLFPDNAFEKSLKTITSSIEDRVLTGRKTDLVSIILCGTPETHNALSDATPGQYEHITTMTPLVMSSVQMLRELSNLTTADPNVPSADVLDALIVAIELIATHCKKLKYTKRIVMFTDNQTQIDWLDLSAVGDMLKSTEIELVLVGAEYEEFQSTSCNEIVKNNYEHWQALIKSGHEGDIMSLDEAYAQTQTIYVKDVSARPSFRGYMYLGSISENSTFLPISSNTYLRTKQTSLPTLKKLSGLSQGPTRKVEAIRKFLIRANDGKDGEDAQDIEVSKEDIQQGYKFGKSVVLVSSEELAMSKLVTKKEMSILGFVKAESVPRYNFFSNVVILTAGLFRTEQSAVALTTLAEALFETGHYALVRFVTSDNAQPKIGILQPELDDVCPVLQYIDVPFADDIRSHKFKSSKNYDDQEDLNLMESLVDAMSNDSLGPDYLSPESNYNPIDWRVKTATKRAAVNPSAPLPELDKRFDDQFKVNPVILEQVGEIGTKIAKKFNVIKVDTKEKKMFAPVTDFEDRAPINDLLDSANADTRNVNFDTMMTELRGELTIGLSTPVEDYYAMLKADAEEDMVEKADTLMQESIFKLLNLSFGNQHYQKVLNCLEALRKTCVEEEDALRYNTVMHELKSWCSLSTPNTPRRQMWDMVKQAGLGLIASEECSDVEIKDVTKQDAEKFWIEADDSTAAVDVDMEQFNEEDLDDLF